MRGLGRIRTALRSWLRPRALDAEVFEELRFHLDREIDANIEAGGPGGGAARRPHHHRQHRCRSRDLAGRPAGRAAASSGQGPRARGAARAQGAGLCRQRRAGRRAGHRCDHRDLQRRVHGHAPAAAVRGARSSGGAVVADSWSRSAGTPESRRSALARRQQPRVRRHCAGGGAAKLQPDRIGRTGPDCTSAPVGQLSVRSSSAACSRSRVDACGRAERAGSRRADQRCVVEAPLRR